MGYFCMSLTCYNKDMPHAFVSKEFPDDGDDLKNSVVSRHESSLKRHAFSLFSISTTEKHMSQWGKNGYGLLLFTGPPGSGTSNAMALATIYMRKTYSSKILYYDFECADPAADLFDDFMKFLELNENQTDDSQWSMLAIDNASLLDMEQTEKMLRWLSDKPDNLHTVFAASHSLFAITMRMKRCDTITQNGLSHEHQFEMINNFVARYGKKLTVDQQSKIVKGAHSNDPTILSILLETLVNFGSMEKLDERIAHLVDQSEFSLFSGLMMEAEDIFQQKKLSECFGKALVVIAMHGEEGISERDLLSAQDIPMGEWAVVKPMVCQFCHGNTLRLRFIQSRWSQDVKDIFSTSWISHLGCEMMDWWMKQASRLKEAVNAISAIYCYIWHLPFEDEDERIVKRHVLSVMLSPDSVLQIKNAYLSFLWHFVWHKDIPFSYKDYDLVGRTLSELSEEEKECYYRKLILIASGLGRNDDEAWCYREISRMKSEASQIQIEEAHALLAEGKAEAAIKTVTGFMSRISGSNSEKFEKRLIRLEAFIQKLSLDAMGREIEHLFDLVEDMDSEENTPKDSLINFYTQLCYQFSFKGLGDWLKMAMELVNNAIERDMLETISISNPVCYYFHMSRVFIAMKTSQFERMFQEAGKALDSSWYAFGGESYQYGRAHILYNYAYKKLHGKICDGRSPFTNYYNLLPYKKHNYGKLADKDVVKVIDQENMAFDALIKELDVTVSYPPHRD